MQLFMNFIDESKQLNQAPFPLKLDYHPQRGRFKIIHQGLMIPNLPAPLHYLNFLSIIGQSNIPILRNQDAIHTTALDTATIIVSCSAHMAGHFSSYSIENDCNFKSDFYQFSNKEILQGTFPFFRLTRQDDELSFDLKIQTTPIISHFTKLKLGIFNHWSLLCHCRGELSYKGQSYNIDEMGSFEYARAINIPYLPLCFFTYQIINLQNQRQLLLGQIRNNFNQIVQSRIYFRDAQTSIAEMFDEDVHFKILRVYPKVKTPNHQEMYLPREFYWTFQNGNRKIEIHAESRGDYKFGLAAGYVGSFKYCVNIDGIEETGESGYCEYIDCRPLKWQEKENDEKKADEAMNIMPCTLKK